MIKKQNEFHILIQNKNILLVPNDKNMISSGPSDDALNPNHVVNCESTSLPSGVRCVPPNSHTVTTYTGWAEVLPLNQYYKISS